MDIHQIIRRINKDLVPRFEELLRNELATRDKEWLIDQVIRLTLDAHSLREADRRSQLADKARRREARLARLRQGRIDAAFLWGFLAEYAGVDRELLVGRNLLYPEAPPKGTHLIDPAGRTPAGEALLESVKDLLYAMLYGTEETGTWLERNQQEILTLTLPRSKAHCLDFFRATTEYQALGTWQDPDSVSHDEQADNVILEVEFGETADELVGQVILRALSLINLLEINEQVLYGRMVNVEESTLIR